MRRVAIWAVLAATVPAFADDPFAPISGVGVNTGVK